MTQVKSIIVRKLLDCSNGVRIVNSAAVKMHQREVPATADEGYGYDVWLHSDYVSFAQHWLLTEREYLNSIIAEDAIAEINVLFWSEEKGNHKIRYIGLLDKDTYGKDLYTLNISAIKYQ